MKTSNKAVMVNRYNNPIFNFSGQADARAATIYLNEHFKCQSVSCVQIDDRLWRVEAKGIPLPEAMKALSVGGFDEKIYSHHNYDR